MIEEIRKQVEGLHASYITIDGECIKRHDVIKILDKHANESDYKALYEEQKKLHKNMLHTAIDENNECAKYKAMWIYLYRTNELPNVNKIRNYMDRIEQKHLSEEGNNGEN